LTLAVAVIALLTAGPDPNVVWVSYGLVFFGLIVYAAAKGGWLRGLLLGLMWFALAGVVALLAILVSGPNPNAAWVGFGSVFFGALVFAAKRGGWLKVLLRASVITVAAVAIAVAIWFMAVMGGLSES
jgi:hypothetical protein